MEETLNRLGLSYDVYDEKDYAFSKAEPKSLNKIYQEFLGGKTTACNWTDIEEDLNRSYS